MSQSFQYEGETTSTTVEVTVREEWGTWREKSTGVSVEGIIYELFVNTYLT